MTTILHIDASVRGERSLSRKLSRAFVDRWLEREPGATIIMRDVGRNPPPFVTEGWVAAAFTTPEDRRPEQHVFLLGFQHREFADLGEVSGKTGFSIENR